MRVTIERCIEGTVAEQLLEVHKMLFAELDRYSVQAQSIPDEQFLELLAHRDVLEFVGWTDEGDPDALLMVVEDLDLVPWISAATFRARYPELSPDQLFYVPCLQVHPRSQGSPLTKGIVHALAHFLSARDGLVGFDTAQWDIDNVGLPEFIERWTAEVAPVEAAEIDTQRYYAYHVRPKVEIDLTEPIDLTEQRSDDLVIDLREPSREAASP